MPVVAIVISVVVPAVVFIALDESLRRPMRRLVTPRVALTDVTRLHPRSAVLRAFPSTRDPDPLIPRPIPTAGEPDRISERTRRNALVAQRRRRGMSDADLQSGSPYRDSDLRHGGGARNSSQQQGSNDCNDSLEHAFSCPERSKEYADAAQDGRGEI